MTQEEAKEKILLALPYMRDAAEKAAKEPGAVVEVGILATQPSGAGNVVARFRAGEFFEDLAIALGAGPLTKDQKADASAKQILDQLGLGSPSEGSDK